MPSIMSPKKNRIIGALSLIKIDAALAEIAKNRGVLYDPDIVDVCLRLFREKGFIFS